MYTKIYRSQGMTLLGSRAIELSNITGKSMKSGWQASIRLLQVLQSYLSLRPKHELPSLLLGLAQSTTATYLEI
ncbi:MAG TPA: hypothetical protein V6C85_05270 [Allocoleopsis sp.]